MSGPLFRVLYIDDDAGLCRMVQRHFERNWIAVETALDGKAGLERLRAGGIDVVALDHHMPGQSGLELLPAIAVLDDAPPVVYVTGEAEGRIAVAALKAGASDYVVKEVDGEFLTLLRSALAAAIEAKRLRRAREQAEEELRASRDRFEALAAERALLIHEINHRVANSLQLASAFLRIQQSAASNPDAKAALSSAIARVAAIGHVHRQLYAADDVSTVDLAHYLRHLTADLAQMVVEGSAKARVVVDARPLSETTDRAIAIGIIVTELVINALKHAYPTGTQGEVRVLCRQGTEPGGIRLTVEDDGKGMPPGPLPAGKGGLGQRIVKMMTVKLEAGVDHDASHKGTRIVIDIPAKPEEALPPPA